MSVHSRPSIQYQDGMELRDKKMTKDCTQPLRIGNIKALNGCAGRLFGAATLHNHKNSANKSNRKAMNSKSLLFSFGCVLIVAMTTICLNLQSVSLLGHNIQELL